MLSKSYCDAGYDLADELLYLFQNSVDTKITSKFVTAMFNLKEIECQLLLGMHDESAIEKFASNQIIHILLLPVLDDELSDQKMRKKYINSIIEASRVNDRLKCSLADFGGSIEAAHLCAEYGFRAASVLKQLSLKITY